VSRRDGEILGISSWLESGHPHDVELYVFFNRQFVGQNRTSSCYIQSTRVFVFFAVTYSLRYEILVYTTS